MIVWFRACTLLLCVLCVWGVLSVLASGPVSIRQPGRFGADPQDWWIVVTVEPQEAHRKLVIEVDGRPGQYRSKDYALEGAKAARVRQHWEKALTTGCYYFTATVYDTSKALASTTSGPVSIIGREGDLCPQEEP